MIQLLTECGVENVSKRIYNGREAQRNRYPWMVLVTDDEGHCGGSLINDRYILTAAHCIESNTVKDIRAYIGAHERDDEKKLTPVKLSQIIKHPKYLGRENDLALLKLSQPLDLGSKNKSISPICLAGPKFSDYSNLFVTGWGQEGSDLQDSKVLNECELQLVDTTTCDIELYKYGHVTQWINPEKQICAGKTCAAGEGDSGGPLATRFHSNVYQVGVVSEGLDPRMKPLDIYEKTHSIHHLKWIKHATRDAVWCYGPHAFFAGH